MQNIYRDTILNEAANRVIAKYEEIQDAFMLLGDNPNLQSKKQSEILDKYLIDGLAFVEDFFFSVFPDIETIRNSVPKNDPTLLQINDEVAGIIGIGIISFCSTTKLKMSVNGEKFKDEHALIEQLKSKFIVAQRLSSHIYSTILTPEQRNAIFPQLQENLNTTKRNFDDLIKKKWWK